MANPVAAFTWDFFRVYLSTRTGGAPGSGVWSPATLVFDGTQFPVTFSQLRTFSSGMMSATDPNGIIGNTLNNVGAAQWTFLGNGTPPGTPHAITFSGSPTPALSSDFWETAQGAWSYGTALYIATVNAGGNAVVLRSTDSGVTWQVQDAAHAPAGNGVLTAVNRVNNTLFLFTGDGVGFNNSIFPFDLTANLYGTPTARAFNTNNLFDLGNDSFSNGVFQFPNGDFLVIYDNANGAKTTCQLWVKATNTWGPLLPISGAAGNYANAVMDPGFDVVHIWTYETGGNLDSPVHYSVYTHSTGLVTADVAIIPATVSGFTGDGVNHCSAQNGMLFVPRDDFNDPADAVWVGSLPLPTTFFKELLPIPAGENNTILTAFVNPGATGYLVGDTGTVNGGVAGYLSAYRIGAVSNNAINGYSFTGGTGYAVGDQGKILAGNSDAFYQVTSVASGVPTGIVLTVLGSGYSVANNISTSAVSGVGTGLKFNVLSVFNGVTNVVLDPGGPKGGGYSVANPVATTTGGAQPGVGTGLTLNITQVGPKTPSCSYMMFPNGYFTTFSVACPVGAGTATLGTPFTSAAPVVNGGTAPFTFSATGLPPGLTINSGTGVISGTPTTPGTFSYTITVTDSLGLIATATCSIVISNPAPPLVSETGTCRTILHLWQHSVSSQVETITDRNDDWTNCGTPGNKFFQGLRLNGDTFGANKTIAIRDSDTLTLHTLQPSPMNHAGRTVKPYSFAVPFNAHMVRRESLDLVPYRQFGIEYVWEATPEFTYTWKTQRTNHGLKGFHHVQQIIMTYASNAPVTLTMTVFDGTAPQVITLASTAGVFEKVVVTLTFNKGMLFDYSLQSTVSDPTGAFQIWKNQLEIRVGDWGRSGNYINYPLLGGRSGDEASI